MEKVNIDQLVEKVHFLEKRNKELEDIIAITKTEIPYPELMYHKLMHLCPIGIGIGNFEDDTILDVSDFFCHVAGFSREEAIGKKATELGLWFDKDRRRIKALLSRDGIYRNVQMQHRKKDGTMFTSLDSGELVRIGNKYYAIIAAIDITAYKEAEQFLVNEHDLNDTITDALPGLFYVVDERYKLLRWNNNTLRITGYSVEELREMTVGDFVAESDRDIIYEDAQKIFQFGENTKEVDLIMKDGSARTFFFSSRRLNYNGRPCIVGSGFDITTQKRALESLRRTAVELEEANTALRVFMKSKDKDQRAMEEKLQINIDNLVIPYLKKLRQAKLDERVMNYVSVLESNLSDVLSPFMINIFTTHQKITPQEIQIVHLIKSGKNTKEISEIINASVNTVNTHRNNIRKKLNLKNSKINLRSYLLSLQ